MKTQYYTYIWHRENWVPKYVGKGSGDRAYDQGGHRIKLPSKEFITIQCWDDEATAFAYEMYLIDFWGRIDNGTGCLANLTDGGENPPSWKGKKRVHSEETKRKMSKSQRGNKNCLGRILSDEAKVKIAKSLTGQKLSEETKIKISEAVKGNKNGFFGKVHSEESRKKMSNSRKGNKNFLGMKHSEATKQKIREAKLGTKQTPETIAKRVFTILKNLELKRKGA